MTYAIVNEDIVFQSGRFGEIRVPSKSVITLIGGIIGFPMESKFVVLDYNPPFSWLHSIENPDLAFVVVNANEFGQEYVDRLPSSDEELEIRSVEDVSLINIVTIRPNPSDSTVNLKAPIMVNVETRMGRQIILDNQDLSIREPLFSSPATE